MKRTTAVLFLLTLLGSGSIETSLAQEVEVIKEKELQELLHNCDNARDILVINFWATWCRPCIEELPYLDALHQKRTEAQVHLISLDPVERLETSVKPFVEKKEIRSRVLLLDETNFDPIINRVDPRWSGAIPATVIVDCATGAHLFFEKKFEENELEQIVDQLINNRSTK